MRLLLSDPTTNYSTEINTTHFVTIFDPSIGPIVTNGDFCISIFARDSGFEGHCWMGDPDHMATIPEGVQSFVLNPGGLYVKPSANMPGDTVHGV